MRSAFVILHRYVGLVMALFLLMAGLTGALLSWNHELDAALSPAVMKVTAVPSSTPLDPLVLRERVEAHFTNAQISYAVLKQQPGHTADFWVQPRANGTNAPTPLGFDQIFVDPYSGTVLGTRSWGDITQGRINLMPFIYRLHYSLALGTVGDYVMGIIALLWSVDCFVGAYLTFPAGRVGGSRANPLTWLKRWRTAWVVRRNADTYRFNFDLHRALGLWFWAVLFVLAWSGVSFNLREVYNPVMKVFFAYENAADELPTLETELTTPHLSWSEAREQGRALMKEAAAKTGFRIIAEDSMSFDSSRGLYTYSVRSDRDVSEDWGSTAVYMDANTGEQKTISFPTGVAAGNTLDHWLISLHMAAMWGNPFNIFMTFVGLAVAALSVTGVFIWWKKRKARRAGRQAGSSVTTYTVSP